MKTIIDCIKAGKRVYTLNEVGEVAILAAEKALAVQFSDEYKDYTAKYGAVCIDGMEFTGVVDNPDLDVINTTISARTITSHVPHDLYVVRDPHIDGIIIWQNQRGEIFQTLPNKPILKLCESIGEYFDRYINTA